MDWVGINAKLSQLLGVGLRINRLVLLCSRYRLVSSFLCQGYCKPSRRTDLVKYVRSGGERIAVKRMCCALLGKHLGVC